MKKQTFKEPRMEATKWTPWNTRENTTPRFPHYLPREFDVSGIYFFSHFKNKRQKEANKDGLPYLNPHVIYIGISKSITGRLEGKKHEKIKEDYIKKFDDESLKCLYYSLIYTGWTTFDFRGDNRKALNAGLLYYERKYIWEFAKTFGKIPLLNRE